MTHIRHVDLAVGSLATSKPFYRSLLARIGWHSELDVVGERRERITNFGERHGFACGAIGLRQAVSTDSGPQYDRHSVGLHHAAFNAATRGEVDRVAQWLTENKHPIESGPDEYYATGYYAVFFYDPDGIRLEVVCGPETDTATSN